MPPSKPATAPRKNGVLTKCPTESNSKLIRKLLPAHISSTAPHRMPEPSSDSNGETPQDNGTPKTITASSDERSLPAFLKLSRSEIKEKFTDLEWQQVNRLAQGRQPDSESEWTLLSGDDFSSRNRYANVATFKNNRVKLNVPEGHSDYINASPIELTTTKSGTVKKFIATQGPKEGIHGHLWRMIWQECAGPAVIIMLTQTHEAGREKCFQYFPTDMEEPAMEINEDDEFDDDFKAVLTLKSIEEDEHTQTTIRELELKTEEGEAKTVWHLLFSGWPDFSIPEDESRDALVRLIQLSEKKNTDQDSPRIVHCSAGVGRSGTFIALDWLLAELEEGSLDEVDDEADPISDLVDTLRQQRMMMVQSDSQYNFLYDLTRQLWKEKQAGLEIGAVKEQQQRDGVDLSREELEREMLGNVAQSVFRQPTTD
jgi:protein-tyrosine phosphatase